MRDFFKNGAILGNAAADASIKQLPNGSYRIEVTIIANLGYKMDVNGNYIQDANGFKQTLSKSAKIAYYVMAKSQPHYDYIIETLPKKGKKYLATGLELSLSEGADKYNGGNMRTWETWKIDFDDIQEVGDPKKLTGNVAAPTGYASRNNANQGFVPPAPQGQPTGTQQYGGYASRNNANQGFVPPAPQGQPTGTQQYGQPTDRTFNSNQNGPEEFKDDDIPF